jgi:hypothetical protein
MRRYTKQQAPITYQIVLGKMQICTFTGEAGGTSSDRPFDLDVRLLTKRLSIMLPIILCPMLWPRGETAGCVLPDGDGEPR